MGLGLGLGLGYGLGYGMGYGGGYYGGYGYPYYGYYGYSPYSYSGSVPYGAAPYGQAPYGSGSYNSPNTAPSGTAPSGSAPYNPYDPNSNGSSGPGPAPSNPPPVTGAPNGSYGVVAAGGSDIPPPPAPGIPAVDSTPASAAEFARRGEAAFRAGDYAKARYEWRHAAVDDPQNPRLLLLLSQALFASGHFDEAAGAAQAGMRQLPKEAWGGVIVRYGDLYGRPEDYTAQLRALEKAIQEKPKDPALRFLAGYHYAYLGFRKEAVDQLDRALKVSPRDELAKELRKATVDSLAKIPERPKS
jgi:tetratricopeptide (TPR) repeat protein